MLKCSPVPPLAGGPARARGFTLIELMIVVAIIGILAAIAYPSYTRYVREARRADAVAAITRVQLAQERYRANNPTYADDLDKLSLPSISTDGYYDISLPSASATGYVVTATAKSGTSQAADTGCLSMSVTVNGAAATYEPPACWKR